MYRLKQLSNGDVEIVDPSGSVAGLIAASETGIRVTAAPMLITWCDPIRGRATFLMQLMGGGEEPC